MSIIGVIACMYVSCIVCNRSIKFSVQAAGVTKVSNILSTSKIPF